MTSTIKGVLAGGVSAIAIGGVAKAAISQGASSGGGLMSLLGDPAIVAGVGAAALTFAAVAWAIRVAAGAQTASADWSKKLAELEAKLEKSESVLSAHPGLVLVWDEDDAEAANGWGEPKILGGPAALASLMSFPAIEADPDKANLKRSPGERLLDAIGDLPIDDDADGGDEKKLREKVAALRTHGIAFSGSIYTQEGRAIEADGRVAGGQVALWLTDPAVRMAEDGGILGKVRENAADLHAAYGQLERSPIPAWRRDADLKLIWVNSAYAAAVEAQSPKTVLKQQIELDGAVRRIAEKAAADRRATEGRVAININGARRIFRITETPVHGAGGASVCGFGVDVTDFEKARVELKQHVDANRRTLDQVPSAVALFGAGQELVYYNSAFQDLWQLEEAELASRPSHSEILDRLRQTGRLPEQADYSAWKKSQIALYTEDVSSAEDARSASAPDEIWPLPDGRSLRVASARHPLGGVVVVFDDITEKLSLEARFNTQIRVQRATLNNLSEGVATFSSGGVLDLFNTAFKKCGGWMSGFWANVRISMKFSDSWVSALKPAATS